MDTGETQYGETQYALSGNVHIAYQVVDDGPVDLVFVPGWVSHVERAWDIPESARFLKRLSSFCRLIMFDKRGTGLSDRVPINQLPTLEERMDDLRAVMEAAGSKRAAVFGFSEGATLCALFAATYPEKTHSLIMFGSFAKRLWSPNHPWGPTIEEREQEYGLISREWGKKMDMASVAPSKVGDEAFVHSLADFLRNAASPGAAIALLKMNTQIDIRNILPTISVPTLVIHRTHDRDAMVEGARWLAGQIPGATFVELPGSDHLVWTGDQKAVLDEVQEFLTGERPVPLANRFLATILFTDLVESTQNVHQFGDETWRRMLDRHNSICQRTIQRYRGRLVKTTGDGIHATFDGPGRAVICAREISDLVFQELGMAVRAGLHTGEVKLQGEETIGVAVHLAARVAALAGPHEVLVSRTVRDLVSGSGIAFEAHGVFELKGFPEKWQLSKVVRLSR
jgi:pimeloyl-ACP methyl ester carboxylesterase